MLTRKSVPTLTIGGFLGAGKTTLVNHLLRQANGRRIVIFVNDFGAINIDHDLIETVEEDRIALSNGCVCCSLNDDLIRSMIDFCENDRPDLFAIEASGVSDPKALASTLQALQMARQAHLQSRIYVLDAAHFGDLGYADSEDLVDHAAASDLILINKSDLVPEDRIAEIVQLLNRSAPGVTHKVTVQAGISLENVLTLSSNANKTDDISAVMRSKHPDFTTVSFEEFLPLSQPRLHALVDLLKETCLRAKGFIPLDEPEQTGRRLQLVGQYFELKPLSAQDVSRSRLVVIGWSHKVPIQQLSRLLHVRPTQ